ncbi:MAG TPA: hypothetical protein VL049_13940 [Candidatus Dormibacteraeota bacterium]|nr:hypothetical protein [Candidatus Dormibacteraeota bacterium]
MAHSNHPTPPAPPAAPDRTALPAERAFVIQLRADADLARGLVRGRLEHLTSGIAALFESAEELVSRMHDAIRSRTLPPSEEDME